MRVLRCVWLAILAGAASSAVYADPASVDQAREALSKQGGDADRAKALEQVQNVPASLGCKVEGQGLEPQPGFDVRPVGSLVKDIGW